MQFSPQENGIFFFFMTEGHVVQLSKECFSDSVCIICNYDSVSSPEFGHLNLTPKESLILDVAISQNESHTQKCHLGVSCHRLAASQISYSKRCAAAAEVKLNLLLLS